MSTKTRIKDHSDDRFALNFDIFFKNPEFDENENGVFESPGLRRRRLKHQDSLQLRNPKGVFKIIADDPQEEFENPDDFIEDSGEDKTRSLVDPASIEKQILYCYYNKDIGVATVGAADVVPPGTQRLKNMSL